MKMVNGVSAHRIVYYNHNQLWRLPVCLYHKLLSPDATTDTITTYRCLEKMFANIPVDRTGTYPHYLNLTSIPPIPKINPSFNKTFAEICDRRAYQLSRDGRRIHVMWSGGLDSTCMLAAFKKIVPRNRLILNYNLNSVLESGNMFDYHIKQHVQHELIPPFSDDRFPMFEDGDLIVSGMAGNQMAWGNSFLDRYSADQLLSNWDSMVSKEEHEISQPLVKKSPRPIITFLDYKWWMMFNLTYFGCHGTYFYGLPKVIQDSMVSFYMTDDFQQWSMVSDEPHERIFTHSKHPMRKYIHSVFPDMLYFDNKKIVRSGYTPYKANWMFVLENGETIWMKIDHVLQ